MIILMMHAQITIFLIPKPLYKIHYPKSVLYNVLLINKHIYTETARKTYEYLFENAAFFLFLQKIAESIFFMYL